MILGSGFTQKGNVSDKECSGDRCQTDFNEQPSRASHLTNVCHENVAQNMSDNGDKKEGGKRLLQGRKLKQQRAKTTFHLCIEVTDPP